mmetsp:Transcript_19747/g.23701  ORF Transcript_19747/g.23701 Transcript_19747/m.23701 type:complete len:220 (+) Transcript_19747:69-728(+)|eukprot:CAMPEP_0195267152 /NCGR_PEP_ID=MMETSP0706-20130129/12424_1 /TAXON_ID=33640 /ORGANISM="Asterionellopsis glacialis, Strain CCMP134" /LENGTH=219 /DNA_ID=CAMNT_0040321857 /DNA_START=36 /DNA_END=695 /DNA_ORIENTATION=-
MKVFSISTLMVFASMLYLSDAGMELIEGACDCDEQCSDEACCTCSSDDGRALEFEDEEKSHERRLDFFARHGKCCNNSGSPQYALVDIPPCQWILLADGACTGGWFSHDCEGMTCGGGFYKVSGSSTGNCVTPGKDGPPYNKRRWTPTKQDCKAKSPKDICPKVSNTPPGGFTYTPRPQCGGRFLRSFAPVESECAGCDIDVDVVYEAHDPQRTDYGFP